MQPMATKTNLAKSCISKSGKPIWLQFRLPRTSIEFLVISLTRQSNLLTPYQKLAKQTPRLIYNRKVLHPVQSSKNIFSGINQQKSCLLNVCVNRRKFSACTSKINQDFVINFKPQQYKQNEIFNLAQDGLSFEAVPNLAPREEAIFSRDDPSEVLTNRMSRGLCEDEWLNQSCRPVGRVCKPDVPKCIKVRGQIYNTSGHFGRCQNFLAKARMQGVYDVELNPLSPFGLEPIAIILHYPNR